MSKTEISDAAKIAGLDICDNSLSVSLYWVTLRVQQAIDEATVKRDAEINRLRTLIAKQCSRTPRVTR